MDVCGMLGFQTGFKGLPRPNKPSCSGFEGQLRPPLLQGRAVGCSWSTSAAFHHLLQGVCHALKLNEIAHSDRQQPGSATNTMADHRSVAWRK